VLQRLLIYPINIQPVGKKSNAVYSIGAFISEQEFYHKESTLLVIFNQKY
jgi:hypothetical protein